MCDDLLDVKKTVVSQYAVMRADGAVVSNPELEAATTPQELITAIFAAYNRCGEPVDKLVKMLGFVRQIRHIANLPLR